MKLYNTLTRTKEEFIPVKKDKVAMYNCGPTVYNYIHVGNARPLVTFDTLRRYFIYRGYDVDFVVNFTDIDDKIINRANEEGVTSEQIAETYIAAFMEDAKGLNLYDYKTINPRATEYIAPMIEFIQGLIDMGAAYEVAGNVYFNIDSAKDYGKLSKKNIEDLQSGARVDINEDKRNPMDFVLWKTKKTGEPSWESPWGAGRPGWHIECSVMAKTLLGETIDIHSGGEDLQFPHHENEIAQSETLNCKPFAKYWLHNGMITVDKEKMSKSLGNFFTIKDVVKEYDYEVLRFFLLSAHYRTPLDYSRETMDHAKQGLRRLYNAKDHMVAVLEEAVENDVMTGAIEEVEKFEAEFIRHMDDDLNTAGAMASLFDMARYANSNFNEKSNKKEVETFYNVFMKLSAVLGILKKQAEDYDDDEIKALVEERAEARKNKDFNRADEIRELILDKGYEIEDTSKGTVWKKR
ncbi:MAG: cysteine--tRNA ligase [Tissierellia bacterium]|nr:cysteine--tRNA ligase [Tissierellia bacterium]